MGSSGASDGQGQGRDPTTSLARFVPRRICCFYLEFDGVDAHATAWRTASAYKLLNETKLGVLLEDLASQGIELAQQSVAAAKRIKGAEIVGLHSRSGPTGICVRGDRAKCRTTQRVILVLRRADRPEIRRLFAAGSAVSPVGDGNRRAGVAADPKRGAYAQSSGQGRSLVVRKGDLILTGNDKVDEILAVIDGKRPSAAEPSTPRPSWPSPKVASSRSRLAFWTWPGCRRCLLRRPSSVSMA